MLQRRVKQRMLMAMSLLLPAALSWSKESDLNASKRTSPPSPDEVTPNTLNSSHRFSCHGEAVSPATLYLLGVEVGATNRLTY